MPTEPQSFEVQGTPYLREEDKISLVKQIIEDLINENPSWNWQVKFMGDLQMVLTYHSYEMDLPSRIKEVEGQAEDAFKEIQKYLKKEYKDQAGSALKMKEDKDSRGHSVEKVSLNNRYYYRSSRVYEI